jgi:1,4-alpha-glucan branching enzyme
MKWLFGINNFSKVSVHELPSGLTRFFVPGNTKAKRVLLSGSFNDWSTGKGMMARTDSGWISDVKLEPGIYAYKFIIDGNWIIDT